MQAKIYLQKQLNSMWNLQDSVLKGLTDEHLAAEPLGTTSPLGIIWLHMAAGEDGFVSMILQESRLYKTGGWAERFNSEKAPNIGEDWSEYKGVVLNVELLWEYTYAVRERTKACLDAVTNETLDETIKFTSDNDPKANVWVLLVGHTLIHAGEIAAIKGVLGGQGLPF